MEMIDLELLAHFCADQRSEFNRDRWLVGNPLKSRLLAVIAHYLSMTSWYGHEVELELIAEELLPGISDKRCFNSELRELAPDISYLSATIRYRIEMRRVTNDTTAKVWPYARRAVDVLLSADRSEAD
ncbi:MAG: hypothetical protein D4S02_06805 [Rhodocyclaceae bacterium]|nr:MAG: hypothetical protein D4S02_06805 [Rhodocyclaceae bacterium]